MAERDSTDTHTRLRELTARAAAKDAIQDYNAAAELYSEATELQAELNGELSLDNADLLFAYGKALYNVAVSKSDVLGSKVAGQQDNAGGATSSGSTSVGDGLIKNAVASGSASSDAVEAGKSGAESTQSKPFFHFSGDENFDDSEEEEGEEEGAGGDDEDEDDFANAFEVLDLARILYHKKFTAEEEKSEKGKSSALDSNIKHIKERLADTYDLQAEISLEGERFTDAVTDLRTALELRQSLFPMEDPSVAECHYKLSLALEFASVSKESEDSVGGDNDHHGKVDEEMRKEAATQMEKAIESCRVRMAQEQKKLDTDDALDEDKATAMKRKIANVKEIIADMEQRLIDLRRPPVSIEDQNEKSEAMLKGILGQIVGHSPTEQKARLDAVSKDANDLSAFVKRKPASSQRADSTNKRAAPEEAKESETKKVRTDDV